MKTHLRRMFRRPSPAGVFLSVLALVATSAGFAADHPASAWTRLADLPRGQVFPSQAPQQIGDRFFMLTGANYRIDAVLIYDPKADAWESRPTALLTSRHHFATAVLHGKLYVAGGCLGESDAVPHRRSNAVESFDPATGLWTPLAPMHTARQALQLVPFENELYAIGGVDREDTPIITMEIYDPARGTWRETPAPWKQSLGWTTAAVHAGRIYLFGSSKETAVFLEFDPRTNIVIERPIGPAGKKRNFGLAGVGDTLLLVGGGTKQPTDTVVGFDLVQNEWRDFPSLPEARAGAGTVAIGNRVLCIGGWGPAWDWAHPNATVFAMDLPIAGNTK